MTIKKFSDFGEPVNEEIIKGIIDFFKGMWNKAIQELEKAANDPNKIKDYVANNTFNLKDDTNVFSEQLKTFEKLPQANDQACLDLIMNILDPKVGCLGEQGIGVLLNDKRMRGEEMQQKRKMLEFIITAVRSQMIKTVKYQITPAARKIDLKDQTHLPDLKKILTTDGTDEAKKKESTLNYVRTDLVPKLINLVKAVKEEDIKKSLTDAGIKTTAADYEVGDMVKYKTKKYNPAKDEDKQLKGAIAQGEVRKVEGDQVTIFNDKIKTEIKKPKTEIIGKTEGQSQKEGGDNAKKAAEALGKIKGDEEKMGDVVKFAGFLSDPANAEKAKQVRQIISGEAQAPAQA